MTKITKGTDFYCTFQLTTEPYEEGLLIRNSTVDNPSVIETKLPHQLTTDDRIKISGHRRNTIVNGKHTATVIDAFKFSVPVAGVAGSEPSGRVSKSTNIAGFTFSGKTKIAGAGTAITDANPTVTNISDADGECSVVLTKVQTALLTAGECILEITYVDTDSKTHIFAIECEVKNA